jgi:hypothetical protein
MKTWLKYGVVALVSFGMGAAFYSITIKQPIASISGNLNIGVNASQSSTFIANFQQRNMNALEARLYPQQSRMVTVDMYVKTQYSRPTAFPQCKSPQKSDLVDGSGKSLSGITVRSQYVRDAPGGGRINTQVCVYKFAFVVSQEKVLAQDWAVVVDGSRFPMMNQMDDPELQLASCDPASGFSCKK